MNIDAVRITRFEMPRVDPAWRTASYAASSVVGFALEISAGGKIGIGGTAAHPKQIAPDDLQNVLEGLVRQALTGADPYEGNAVRQTLRDQNINSRAFLAADLALHDLIGKLSGLPCYVLWGGKVIPGVDVVRMVGMKSVAELEPAVGTLVQEGYRHFKIKIGTGLEEDVERIAMLRRVFGSGLWIGVDGNGAYTPDGAIELSHKLEPYDVSLIEQPIDYLDLDGLAKLSAASPIPIMADQYVTDVASALAVCQRHAAPVVSVKVTKMGSIDECRRVAEVCLAFGVGVHIGGSVAPSVVDMAQAQLAASLSGIHPQCEVGEFRAVTGDLIEGVNIQNGRLELGEEPGFGVGLAAQVTASAMTA